MDAATDRRRPAERAPTARAVGSLAAGTHARAPDAAEPTGAAEAPARDERHDLSFDDPYWDDAFCSWLDPTMRACCG